MDTRAAARGFSAISLNTVVGVAGGLLFVTLIPRALGAEVYGQLAYSYAYTVLFQLAGELGYQEILARFLPELREDAPRRAQLICGLFAVKLLAGIALGALAGALAAPVSRFLPLAAGATLPAAEAHWLTGGDATLIGLSVALRVWATGLFALLLAEGRTGQWSIETTWRPLVVTGLLAAVFHARSLPVALTAFAVHEVLFLLAGLWWTRGRLKSLSPRRHEEHEADVKLIPLLRLGATFALANFALMALFRMAPLVAQWFTGLPAQAGFVDLALSGLLVVYTFVGQLAYALVPVLTRMQLEGRANESNRWLRRFLGWGTGYCALAAGAMWFLAPAVTRLLFGPGFDPAVLAIRALAPGALFLSVLYAGVVLATVQKQPWRKVRAAFIGLLAFLVTAWILRGQQAGGIALAFSLGLAAAAFAMSWRMLSNRMFGGWSSGVPSR